MALPGNNEVIEIDVIINTQIANKNLRDTLNQVKSLEDAIKRLSSSSGASINQVGQYLKTLYASQLKVSGASKETQAALKAAFGNDINSAIKNINQEIKASEQSGKGFNQVLNLIRGTLVAIGVFRVFQFIEDSIRKAIGTAKEFEQSLYRLTNVERILSQGGIEISVKGLQQAIKDTKALLPIFSEADITQEVASVALLTKELGFNENQIKALSQAIGILNIRSTENESLLETTNKVVTALITGQARGVAALGLSFSEATLKTKALELGLIKAGESLSDLTDKEKALAKLQIILENTGNELSNVNDYLQTDVARIEQTQAAWEDLLKTVGQLVLPFIVSLAPAIDAIRVGFDNVKISISGLLAIIGSVIVAFRLLFSGSIHSIYEFRAAMLDAASQIYDTLTNKFFPDKAIENIDTATEAAGNLGNAIDDLSQVKGFDDLQKDLESLQKKIEETQADFVKNWNTDVSLAPLGRKIQDFNIKMVRLHEDYAIKRDRINQDANDAVADSNKKYHQNEIDEEAKFQEQLRQLREKFLFNLEDALRERDARQILRLQAQYQMDKTALENENALRQKNADEQHQADLDRIRKERDDRLAELNQEEALKTQREQEDFALEQARAAEDHAIEMERLRQEINDRLMVFAQAIGDEYNLNEDGVNALYGLLQQYYGPNGKFNALYDYSYKSMVAKAQAMLSQVNAIVAQSQAVLASNLYAGQDFALRHPDFANIGPQATGGTYFATKPTVAMFGEAGPEFASFTPARKMNNSGGYGGVPAQNGGGAIDLNVWLSPDLEARVVNTALNETANAVVKVKRSKS